MRAWPQGIFRTKSSDGEPGNGFIALGGATLAAAAAGSGLVETLTFSSKVVYLRYRVAR